MIATKHTAAKDESLWAFDEVSLDVSAPSGKVICKVEDQGAPDYAHERYGKLIAAAPAMLEALTGIFDFMEQRFIAEGYNPSVCPTLVKAKAAIQLATE